MDNTIVSNSPTKSYKRQRYMSCPSINNQEVTVKFRQKLPRIHRQSFIDEFSCAHSNYSTLKSSNSEPTAHYLLNSDQIGVKAFDIWRPRRSSANGVDNDGAQNLATRATCTINEDRVLTEMNVDRKRALETSKNDVALWYKLKNGQDNPFKSDLFIRVLYLIGSGVGVEDDDDDDNNSSIHDQFLTEEQIRENQFKEQRVNVERLKHELASGDIQYQSKSGTATPVELIYQSIPNLIKRNSFSSSKLEQVFKSNQLKSDDKKNSIKNSNDNILESFLEPHNFNNKDNHKLTGREKSMFAPLTF